MHERTAAGHSTTCKLAFSVNAAYYVSCVYIIMCHRR